MKGLTWLFLVVVAICSLFKLGKADLNNNVLAVTLMLLLLALFSDLNEFNFWGLRGKKTEKDLKELENKNAIPEKNKKDEVSQEQIAQASVNNQIQLMDTSQGNFLALAFEIERLLRIYGTVTLVKDIPQTTNPIKLVRELQKSGLLTENGVKQIEAIRWLRNILVHGRQGEINEATLQSGIQLAYSLHQELVNQLNPQNNGTTP